MTPFRQKNENQLLRSIGEIPVYTENWTHPVIHSFTPSGVRTELFSMLTHQERSLLEKARSDLDSSYSPQTRNHRFGGVIATSPNGERFELLTPNFDASMRQKHCAEEATLIELMNLAHVRLESIVTISARYDENNGRALEPPVAPCGSCRDFILARSAEDGTFLFKADRATRLVMANTDLSYIRVCSLGQDFAPLNFLTGNFKNEALMNLNIDGLQVSNRRDIAKRGFPAADLTSSECKKLFQAADESCHERFGKSAYGVSVISLNSEIASATTWRPDSMPSLGPISGEAQAFAMLAAKFGSNLVKAVAISCHSNATTGGITPPSGFGMQYIFDAAQRVGRDIPVFIIRKGAQGLLSCPISRLFPLGEGPLHSKSTAYNLSQYRMLSGKIIE